MANENWNISSSDFMAQLAANGLTADNPWADTSNTGQFHFTLPNGQVWTPSGSGAGIKYMTPEMQYQKYAQDYALSYAGRTRSGGGDNPFYQPVADYDTWLASGKAVDPYYAISGDMSALLGQEGSNTHAEFQYRDDGNGNMVLMNDPYVWQKQTAADWNTKLGLGILGVVGGGLAMNAALGSGLIGGTEAASVGSGLTTGGSGLGFTGTGSLGLTAPAGFDIAGGVGSSILGGSALAGTSLAGAGAEIGEIVNAGTGAISSVSEAIAGPAAEAIAGAAGSGLSGAASDAAFQEAVKTAGGAATGETSYIDELKKAYQSVSGNLSETNWLDMLMKAGSGAYGMYLGNEQLQRANDLTERALNESDPWANSGGRAMAGEELKRLMTGNFSQDAGYKLAQEAAGRAGAQQPGGFASAAAAKAALAYQNDRINTFSPLAGANINPGDKFRTAMGGASNVQQGINTQMAGLAEIAAGLTPKSAGTDFNAMPPWMQQWLIEQGLGK